MLERILRVRRSRRAWTLFLVIALLLSVASPFLWANIQLRAARHSLERRAYAKAQAHLAHYLRIWPNSPSAHLLAARCARGLGNFDEAQRLLSACRWLETEPEDLILEGRLLDAQRGTLGALEADALLRRVAASDPETPHILEALVLGYLYTNRLGEAMECVERWLAYTPGDSQALYLRGLVWEGMGAIHEAGEDYRQAARRDPRHSQARERWAEYLLYAGQYQEAAQLFRQLAERDPQDVGLQLGLARCRHALGEIPQAESLLDNLIANGKATVPVLLERARLARGDGDLPGAEKWFRQALTQDPSDYDACYGLGQCLRALSRPRDAEEFEARAAQLDRAVKRLRDLHEQIARHPEDLELPYQAGLICLRSGQKAEARRWFRNVLQRNPSHEGARHGLEEAVHN
jgi:tetratricopeptide (TPR) repeat protein